MDTFAHAECAEGTGVALPPTIEARSGTAIVQVRVETRASGVRGPGASLTSSLSWAGAWRCLEWTPLTMRTTEMNRSLWWVRL